MANQVSDQIGNQDAVPSVPNVSSTFGTKKIKFFSGAVSAAKDLAVGAIIDLCDLPKGARLLGGAWGNDDAFSGAGVTLNIGWSGTPAALASGLDCAAVNHTAIGNTKALNFNTVLTEAKRLQAVTIGNVIVATGTYYGYVEFI